MNILLPLKRMPFRQILPGTSILMTFFVAASQGYFSVEAKLLSSRTRGMLASIKASNSFKKLLSETLFSPIYVGKHRHPDTKVYDTFAVPWIVTLPPMISLFSPMGAEKLCGECIHVA